MSPASKLLAEQYQSVLAEIKPAVSEAVFARLNESIRRHQDWLERLQRENKLLRELRRLELLEKYGPSAETLSDEQLELLELEPGVSTSEVEAESQRRQLRAMGRELLEDDYIQADETPVSVQMHDGQGKNRQAYLWQYSRPKGPVVFDFRLGREREGPKRFLGNFGGILQSDGYGGYDRVGGPRIVHADCWAHARRKFFDAVKLNPKDQTAIGIVAQMDHVRLVRRLRSIRRPLAKITSNPRAGRIWRVRVYGSSAQTGNVN